MPRRKERLSRAEVKSQIRALGKWHFSTELRESITDRYSLASIIKWREKFKVDWLGKDYSPAQRYIKFQERIRKEIGGKVFNPGSTTDAPNSSLGLFGNTRELQNKFIESLEFVAKWAKSELIFLNLERSKTEIPGELERLEDATENLCTRLKNLSLTTERLFSENFHHQSYIKSLQLLLAEIDNAHGEIPKLGKYHLATAKKKIAVEFAARILQVAEEYGVHGAATYHPDRDVINDAIVLIESVGASIGLNYSKSKWRDNIVSATRKETKPESAIISSEAVRLTAKPGGPELEYLKKKWQKERSLLEEGEKSGSDYTEDAN